MRWVDHIAVPWPLLALGAAIGWILAGFAALWLIKVPAFDARDRVIVNGTVTSVAVVDVGAKQALDFTVRGQGVRLRVQPAVFMATQQGRAPQALVVGATARVAVPRQELESPYRPAPSREPTASADALEIEGQEVLSLDASRQWADGNRRMAQVLLPAFALAAALLTTVAAVKWRAVAR